MTEGTISSQYIDTHSGRRRTLRTVGVAAAVTGLLTLGGCASKADADHSSPVTVAPTTVVEGPTKAPEITYGPTEIIPFSAGTATLAVQKGIDVSKTPYNKEGIQSALETAERYAQGKPVNKVEFLYGSDSLELDFQTTPAPEVTTHTFKVVTNIDDSVQGHKNNPDAKAVTARDTRDPKVRTTYFELIGPAQTASGTVFDGDVFDTVVESLNNVSNTQTTPESRKNVASKVPADRADDIINLLQNYGQEGINNSVALAAALKKAGLDYDRYAQEASTAIFKGVLPNNGQPIIIRYVVLTPDQFKAL